MPPEVQIDPGRRQPGRVATVLLALPVFGRPMAATRDVRPDRVKTLRDAYLQLGQRSGVTGRVEEKTLGNGLD